MSWFFAPFLAGFLATALLRLFSRRAGIYTAVLGLLIAVSFVLYAYSGGTPSDDDFGPSFVIVIVGYLYMFWLVGVGAGAGLLALFAREPK